MHPVKLIQYSPDYAEDCANLLAALPQWFGLPESNKEYLANLDHLPSWLALINEKVVGIVSLEAQLPGTFEVSFLAVAPDHHRQGIGNLLVKKLETEVKQQGGRWLLVKTLAPSHPDPFYARTREFYKALGFDPLFESNVFWGAENPAVVMIKAL
jgi:ribosomal protein S18 acetylase RimI-like enzyme